MTEFVIQSSFHPDDGAGLGDTLTRCFTPNSELGYFKALKARGDTTHLCLHSGRPYIDEIFVGNPYIDRVTRTSVSHKEKREEQSQPICPECRMSRRLTDADKATLTWERPQIYLTEAEQSTIDAFGPGYIAIHPWAAVWYRVILNYGVDLPMLVESICNHGQRVALLGGNGIVDLLENFDGAHPNLLNAVNRLSARAQVYLAFHATKFIGSQSSYACAAEIFGVPSLVLGHVDDYDVAKPYRCGPFAFQSGDSGDKMYDAIDKLLGFRVAHPSKFPVVQLRRRPGPTIRHNPRMQLNPRPQRRHSPFNQLGRKA
jgi:hypothetical protein